MREIWFGIILFFVLVGVLVLEHAKNSQIAQLKIMLKYQDSVVVNLRDNIKFKDDLIQVLSKKQFGTIDNKPNP